jgi:hypothetical protein
MKKMLPLLAIALIAASCGNNETPPAMKQDTVVTAVKEEKPAVNFIYPSAYPADWKIGDAQNIVKVQEMYRIMLSDSNYEAIRPYLADSIMNVRFDNHKAKLSADDFIAEVKRFRKGYKSLNEEFRNYVALRSDAQNADMVLLWLKEVGVRQNGKKDSSGYQETWKFNNQGKVDYRSTFVRYDF